MSVKYKKIKWNKTNIDITIKLHRKKMKWNKTNIDITIKWHRKELNNIEKQFIGDLYSNSIYNFDSIILNNTNQIILEINNTSNYNIKFYISRII